MNWMVLAMAYHQLQNVEQREQCLKTADKFIALAEPKQAGGPVDLFAPIGLSIRCYHAKWMNC